MVNVTIITVCLNAGKYIEKTINSILNQTYTDYEYIIQDADSQDNTNYIINTYKPLFENKGITLKHNIEKDSGIYDAMSKALNCAEGEWIIYMNAGDCFFSSSVLSDIFYRIIDSEIGVLYGHTMVELNRKNYKLVAIHDEQLLKSGMSMGHQSMLVRKSLLEKYGFNLKYKIAADYELCLNLYINNIKFLRLNLIVSRYSREGISSKLVGLHRKEVRAIKRDHGLPTPKDNYIIDKFADLIVICFPVLSDLKYCINQLNRMAITFKEVS